MMDRKIEVTNGDNKIIFMPCKFPHGLPRGLN